MSFTAEGSSFNTIIQYTESESESKFFIVIILRCNAISQSSLVVVKNKLKFKKAGIKTVIATKR